MVFYFYGKKDRTMALKRTEIYIDDKGDRNCPSCKSESIHLQPPELRHERTQLHLKGFCEDCGCNFEFVYVLYVSDVKYK